MTETSKEACLRCGDFDSDQRFAIADIPLCHDCLDRPLNQAGPLARALQFFKDAALFMILGASIGLGLGYLKGEIGQNPDRPFDLLAGFALGLNLSMLGFILIRGFKALPNSFPSLKKLIQDHFHLPADSPLQNQLCDLYQEQPKPSSVSLATTHLGLLVSSHSGFLYLGLKQRNLVLKLSDIQGIEWIEPTLGHPLIRIEMTPTQNYRSPVFLTLYDHQIEADDRADGQQWFSTLKMLLEAKTKDA